MQMQRVPNIRNPARLSKIGVVRLGVKDEHGRGREVGHFILDLADEALQERALRAYGDKPTVMDVRILLGHYRRCLPVLSAALGDERGRDLVSALRRQRSDRIVPGETAAMPCPAFGRECRKTTVLKFLLPLSRWQGMFCSPRKASTMPRDRNALNLVHQATGGLSCGLSGSEGQSAMPR